ncbi:ZIP family zinc transporter [soil metagenome]
MGQALIFGLIGSSALVFGGALGAYWTVPHRVSGVLLAFASGTLISALAFELFPEAEQTERLEEASSQGASAAVGFALLAAVTLDGVPENLALGVSLLSGGGSIVLLVAIFCSNFPEALAGAVAMRRGGRSASFAVGIWTLAALLLTLAVLFGRAVFAQFPAESLAFPLAFAGGAVLASLADTLMPEAFEHGRPLNSMSTAVGFLLSFVLSV